MIDKPLLVIYEEQTFNVGQYIFTESTAKNDNAVVFGDNCETGYFYAVDRSNNGLRVLDGLHIYNVANVTDRHKPSTVKILWNQDLSKAYLSINNYYHAVFDFQNHAGYCRNGFPEASNSWSDIKERKLTDLLLEELSRHNDR